MREAIGSLPLSSSHLVVKELVLTQAIRAITLDGNTQVLSRNRILSAPIWNDEQQAYIGLFDTGDMIAFLLTVFKKAGAQVRLP